MINKSTITTQKLQTKKSVFKFLNCLGIILISMWGIEDIKAQTNCSTSISVNDTTLNINNANGNYWFSFQSSSNGFLIDIDSIRSNTDSLFFYSGVCNSLTLTSSYKLDSGLSRVLFDVPLINTVYYAQ